MRLTIVATCMLHGRQLLLLRTRAAQPSVGGTLSSSHALLIAGQPTARAHWRSVRAQRLQTQRCNASDLHKVDEPCCIRCHPVLRRWHAVGLLLKCAFACAPGRAVLRMPGSLLAHCQAAGWRAADAARCAAGLDGRPARRSTHLAASLHNVAVLTRTSAVKGALGALRVNALHLQARPNCR